MEAQPHLEDINIIRRVCINRINKGKDMFELCNITFKEDEELKFGFTVFKNAIRCSYVYYKHLTANEVFLAFIR